MVLGLIGCGNYRSDTAPDASKAGDSLPKHTLTVTSNGWHTGIILNRYDLPSDRIPETQDLPKGRYLEFGWGDANYYPAENPSIGMALSAALFSTPSVLHMAAFDDEPAARYPSSEVLSLPVNVDRLMMIIDHIDASFERAGQPRVQPQGPGLYSDSHFYPARGRFHFFNTCNTWSARTLEAGGIDIGASGVQTADDLMERLKAYTEERDVR